MHNIVDLYDKTTFDTEIEHKPYKKAGPIITVRFDDGGSDKGTLRMSKKAAVTLKEHLEEAIAELDG